ncbi:MAG TPA: phosphoribosylformylglycinamidine cyclo-ligase [Candidatus Eremiobacteraceae bacterium]|nr:phosphoribosylformylglycinamidine cyclo-ligase [Candidatus Eremiobacteraceae bacterium]
MPDAYSVAGVDIDKANETVERYQQIMRQRRDPRVLRGIGGFSGCFELSGFNNPVLVASSDGVGTKVLVAAALDRYDTVGQDLVNHCVNDILCSNATPLFFLDYLAMGALQPDAAATIVHGIALACDRNDVALLGGETAEMPGVYTPPHFDIAGTIVGAVERADLLDFGSVAAGDAIVGLPANGLHTNGYSLARKVLPQERWHEKAGPESDVTIADALLAIHPSYLGYVRAVQRAGVKVKSMAHITGGGLAQNLPRAIPEHLAARLDSSAWEVPPIAALVAKLARLSAEEAYRTLNMGIGFCLIVAEREAQAALSAARAAIAKAPIVGAERQTAAIVGAVEPRHPCGPSVIIA